LRATLALPLALAALSLRPPPVAAQPPGLTLEAGRVNAMISVENDASAGQVGEVSSIAPDLHVGVTDALTGSVVTSGGVRAGSRGSAGNGLCATEGCAHTYDNGGIEALYGLARGDLALAANAGVHATSFDDDRYVAKLGAKLRYRWHGTTLWTAPSITVPVTRRDATTPARDRLWLPIIVSHPIVGALAGGVAVAGKAPLDAVRGEYEIGAGALVTYTVSPALQLGTSWVESKLLSPDRMVPAGTHGYDYRALQMWISATY